MTFDQKLDIAFNDWLKHPVELTQVELASRVGVTHQYIAQVERKARKNFARRIDKSWFADYVSYIEKMNERLKIQRGDI